ncbi:MAG: metal ABC transporter permease [Solirubrobacteraceae bacterium]
MTNAWIVGTLAALVAGVVGFFVVLRGSAFAAHAIPNGAFAGAAVAALLGLSTILGLAVFSVLAALGIGALSRRGRHDAATALVLTSMLGLGSLFLSFGDQYASAVYSLLFGELLGISGSQVVPTLALAIVCVALVGLLYRPLLLSSLLPDAAAARGVPALRMELAFLLVVALASAMTVPVVGTLLIFSLMIGPPAAARCFTSRPPLAVALSVLLALLTVWVSLAASYGSDYPVGFFVGALSGAVYALGRVYAALHRSRRPALQAQPFTI